MFRKGWMTDVSVFFFKTKYTLPRNYAVNGEAEYIPTLKKFSLSIVSIYPY